MDYQHKYIDLILGVSLSLQQGEALSINTSERNADFAQLVAAKASEITQIPVSIVLIEEGVVKDVFTIAPIEHELIAETSQHKVLLRLEDASILEEFPKESLENIASNMPLLQKVGNLGPPQADKEIAPWAIAPVPTNYWARSVFVNSKDPVTEMWKLFANLLFLDDPKYPFSYTRHLKKLNEVVKRIITKDKHYIHIHNEECDLYLKMVNHSFPRHKLTLIGGTRAFIPTLFDHGLTMVIDSSFTHGTVTSTRPFLLLGQWVEGASLVFNEGKVVSFTASNGQKALQTALGIDEGACKIGFISLTEEKKEIPKEINYYGSKDIDESITSFIMLGMGESNHLKGLETFSDENELHDKSGLNISTFRGKIPIGDDTLNIDMYDDDSMYSVMIDGKFII
jgi:aminopeptidase